MRIKTPATSESAHASRPTLKKSFYHVLVNLDEDELATSGFSKLLKLFAHHVFSFLFQTTNIKL